MEEKEKVETKEEVKETPAKPKMDTKKIITYVCCGVACVIVLVILINIIGTKTLKCKYESEIGDYTMKVVSKEKFKFGKPYSRYSKTVTDYSDSDMDKSDIKDKVKDAKKALKKSCKKSDGCKYSIKQSGKKVTLVMKKKFDKDEKEDWLDDYDYKEYVEDFKDKCDDLK